MVPLPSNCLADCTAESDEEWVKCEDKNPRPPPCDDCDRPYPGYKCDVERNACEGACYLKCVPASSK